MKEAASAAFFLSLGLFYLVSSWRYEAGTIDDPGPGFFPRIIALIMILNNLLLLVLSLRNRRGKKALPAMGDLNMRNVLSAAMLVGALIVYLLVLDTLGFLLISPLLVFFLAWVMGGSNWLANLILGAVSSAVIYWLFWIIMRVPIPTGLLGSR